MQEQTMYIIYVFIYVCMYVCMYVCNICRMGVWDVYTEAVYCLPREDNRLHTVKTGQYGRVWVNPIPSQLIWIVYSWSGSLLLVALDRAKVPGKFYAKAQYLESSVMCYDNRKNEVVLYNSRADFVAKYPIERKMAAVGEVESSPYVQMIVVGMGWAGHPDIRHLIGMTLSHIRSMSLYWIDSDINVKVHSSTLFYGPARINAFMWCRSAWWRSYSYGKGSEVHLQWIYK